MNRSLPSVIRDLGPRLALRTARHGLDDHVLESDPWYDSGDVCEDDAIFIGGCGRSGTTLLRELLSRHSRIACGPDSHVLSSLISLKRLATGWNLDRRELRALYDSSSSVVRFAESFFRRYAAQQGKPRWADKSPGNVRVAHRLLSRFPNGRFVHIIRDGRDVVCSLRNHPRQTIRRGQVVDREIDQPIEKCSLRWIHDVSGGLPLRGHPRYTEVRYEQLVTEPEKTLQELCVFLGEAFEPGMLEAGTDDSREKEPGRWLNNPNARERIQRGSIGRWRRDLPGEERLVFDRLAGELLIALGYARDRTWIDARSPETSTVS